MKNNEVWPWAAVTMTAPYLAYDVVVARHRRAGAHAVGDVPLSNSFLDV